MRKLLYSLSDLFAYLCVAVVVACLVVSMARLARSNEIGRATWQPGHLVISWTTTAAGKASPWVQNPDLLGNWLLQVGSTTATAWTVVAEGSIDGGKTTYPLAVHDNVAGSGSVTQSSGFFNSGPLAVSPIVRLRAPVMVSSTVPLTATAFGF